MKQIAILCHWSSGSSILAKTLRDCGMQIGNEKTWWTAECEEQCEHGLLNTVGNLLYHGKDAGIERVKDVLKSYDKEASLNKWNIYGVKFTHALQKRCWEHISPIFEKYWPDAKYIVQIRHPLEIICELEKAKSILEQVPDSWITNDEIVASWISTFEATKELVEKGATILIYPDVFITGQIKKVVKELGLKWNKSSNIFNKKDIMICSGKELTKFRKDYPEADRIFKRLKAIA